MSEGALIPVLEDSRLRPERTPAAGAAAPLEEVRGRFNRNVVMTIAARVINMTRGVVLVPFLLAHIGLQAYGIWTTAFILVSYVGITTMGFSSVYMKYAAEFQARREFDRLNSLLSTGLAITVPLCTAIFIAFYLGWNGYAHWLHLPSAHAADGREAILIVLGVFLSSIAFNGFGDVLAGCQQIAPTQVFLMLGLLVEFGLILLLVSHGRGIRGLAEAYLARTLVDDGLTIWWAWRKLDWLHLSPRLVRRESIRYVLHFGGMVQFQSFLDIFLSYFERVAALGLIGVAAAGLMDVAKKWQNAFSSVPMAFFYALLPAASHVDAASSEAERKGNLRKLYLSSSRHSNLCTVAFVAVVAWWSSPILHVWLGNQLPKGQMLGPLFVAFSIGMQWHMLTGPGTSMFRGMGRVYEEFSYSIPNVILLAVTLPAARMIQGRWTALGIGIAVTVATILSASILMGRVLFVLDLKLTQYLREVIVPGVVPYCVAGVLAWPVCRAVAASGRWTGAALILAFGIAYVAISAAILFRWFLMREERAQIGEYLRRATAIFRRQAVTA